jgi:adenosylcobinamide-GDP ribazoletransferase
MNLTASVRRNWFEFTSALQFLTRIPVPSEPYKVDSLARSVKFFPLVGAVVGGSAALLNLLLAPHLPRAIAALLVVIYLVMVTGCLQEDGLADVADGFGGGRDRTQILLILRDSRIGSYGATALALSLLGRVLLISSLPLATVAPYLISAHLLCRWTVLPLSYFLPAARPSSPEGFNGQGARIASLTSIGTLIGGTLFAFALTACLLRRHAILPIICVMVLTLLAGLYYKRRIGGITGDCFGATMQLAEIVTYLCGAWTR